ncbi:MAG: fibronectin type III domain-containing protein [Acetobacteraceae bacterium]
MPTISQLPSIEEVTAADAIPVSQGGMTHSVSVGALLASMQPAIMTDQGMLLGRTSLGAGGPESVVVGAGLMLNDGSLTASAFDAGSMPQRIAPSPADRVVLHSDGLLALLPLPSLRGIFTAGSNVTIDTNGTISASGTDGDGTLNITDLAPVPTIAGGDLVAISQNGSDHAISYANLLDGLTIDLAQPAVPANDTDTLWVAQGSSTMLRQTLAAVWSWLATKQPSYHLPVVEVLADTTLDGSVHNGRILVCTQAVTLAPAPQNMGNGFHCDVLNLSGGTVTFASGIMTSSGSTSLPSGQAASMRVVTYSGGTIVFASLAGSSSGGTGGGTPPAAPGQVTGLAATSPTASSMTLAWTPPGTGGTANSYTVQYRATGSPTWLTFTAGVTAATVVVTGLAAATAFEFQVYAVNGGGSGLASPLASGTTAAVAGSVISASWLLVPVGPYVHGGGSIGVNAQVNPASSAVQFGFSPSSTVPPSSWVEAVHVNSNLWGAYVSTPATAGTWYAWVEGTDGSAPTVWPTSFTVT